MNIDQLNNLVYSKTVRKVCELSSTHGVTTVFWHNQNYLIVLNGYTVHTYQDDTNNMDEIVRQLFVVPDSSRVTFSNLHSIVMDVDTLVRDTEDIEHYSLKNVGEMGDFIYGQFAVTN
jgi:hypothetical protein